MKVLRWLVDECPARVAVLASAALGAAMAFAIFGPAYLLGTSAFWSAPVGDFQMMTTGWEYYVHDPWHWPLAHTFGTGGPAGLNILYLDTAPLVAFVGKLLRTVVGGRWNPYGPWHLAIYVLQAVFATLVGRRLGMRSLLGGLGLALLALSMFVFIMRFYHEALNSHFLLLWAFLVYLRTESSRPSWRLGAEWGACLSCAVLIHPYLGAMAAVIAAAAFVKLASANPRRSLETFVIVAVGVTAVLFVFGYIPQRIPGHAGDFGKASMNLMSPLLPYYGRILPSFGIDQEATGLQCDGGNFLGIGVLALSLVALVASTRAAGELVKRNKALVVALAALALYAPSNRWWFGMKLVLSYEIPSRLETLFENTRATGRFFWPVGYGLLFAAAVLVHRRFGRRGTALVFLAGLLQLVDSTIAQSIAGKALAAPARHELDWEALGRQLDGATNVKLYPSHQCWYPIQHVPDRVFAKELEVEFIAASRGLKTNAGRAGRPTTDCAREVEERALAAHAVPPAGEVDVFFVPAFHTEILSQVEGRSCRELDDLFVCKAGTSP